MTQIFTDEQRKISEEVRVALCRALKMAENLPNSTLFEDMTLNIRAAAVRLDVASMAVTSKFRVIQRANGLWDIQCEDESGEARSGSGDLIATDLTATSAIVEIARLMRAADTSGAPLCDSEGRGSFVHMTLDRGVLGEWVGSMGEVRSCSTTPHGALDFLLEYVPPPPGRDGSIRMSPDLVEEQSVSFPGSAETISDAGRTVSALLADALDTLAVQHSSREASLAKTKIQEAMFWAAQAAGPSEPKEGI